MRFSVIITTYNRVDTLPRAIESVLGQGGDFELIVVDDGSSDGTAAYLAQLDDPRVRVIRRGNGGLSAARNTGLENASSDWTVFLDDDDMALPGWLKTFEGLANPGTGIVCCAADYCQPDGTWLGTARPRPMGPMFANQTGLFLAGTFACRTELLRAVGGYDERMTCSHQTELALRLTSLLDERGMTARNTDDVRLQIERRNPDDRPLSNPVALYHGTRHLLDKHHERFAGHAQERARSFGVLGVSAARLERWAEARTALYESARAEPMSVRRWVRVATALFPPLARRVWRASDYRSQVRA